MLFLSYSGQSLSGLQVLKLINNRWVFCYILVIDGAFYLLILFLLGE